MCTCTSCKVTDSFAAKSFADWPRGDPAGKRASESLYASHVAFGRKWGGARKPECAQRLGAGGSRREDPHARYFFPGAWRDNKLIPAEETTAGYVAAFLRLNGLLPEKQTPAAKPAPARPAAVGKPQQHFAAPMEGGRDAGIILAMPKDKAKRPPGRPRFLPEGSKRFLIWLDPQAIAEARRKGGKVSLGVRKALGSKC